MNKNSMPPRTKPPPLESSEEESGSSEEETEDEEQAEGGSDSEPGSNTSSETVHQHISIISKPISISPTKQQSAVKGVAAVAGSSAKRTREANGRNLQEDEPPNKRKKPEVATPAPKAAPKPTAKPTPSGKEKSPTDLTAEKDSKKISRKKPHSPPAGKPTTSNRSEQGTPQKPKVSFQPWSPDEELALSKELQKDRVNNVYGSVLPSARSDRYWEKLMGKFPFMEKYEKQQRNERLCEKVRRMRLRYESLNSRLKAGETGVCKNRHEEVLLGVWETIWGPKKATPSMLNSDDDDEDEDEEGDGSADDGSEEDVPTQGKERPSTVGRVTALKKAINKKGVESSSDDDESNEEDSPATATPPTVVAAPAVSVIAATAATTVAEKHAQGGDAVIPAAVEKVVRVDALPRVTDALLAENLALLRDMRGTCVKMVEEAKTQSLLLSTKMLEETHSKTIQIVQEARVKSAEIMEELRLVVARVGTIAGQQGWMNSCNDLSDNTFQGTGLLLGNGALPLGDLDGKWREQSEAEQSLLLQRLQLVQEQARIQQEGIRLKLSRHKQQT